MTTFTHPYVVVTPTHFNPTNLTAASASLNSADFPAAKLAGLFSTPAYSDLTSYALEVGGWVPVDPAELVAGLELASVSPQPRYGQSRVLSATRRTFMTALVFLGEDDEGVELLITGTDNVADGEPRFMRVPATPGTVVLFPHYGPHAVRHCVTTSTPVLLCTLVFACAPLTPGLLLPSLVSATRQLVVLLGPPGAGKSTQVRLVADALAFLPLDFGHCIRTAVRQLTPLGKRVVAFRDACRGGQSAGSSATRRKGGWLPNELCLAVVQEYIALHGAGAGGFVLDGFPRLRSQSLVFEGQPWCLLCAVLLEMPEVELLERVAGRLLDKTTGDVYHRTLRPPPADLELVSRAEDTPESLHARLEDWHGDTVPLVQHYDSIGLLRTVDAMEPVEAVTASICAHVHEAQAEHEVALFPASFVEAAGLDDLHRVSVNMRTSSHDSVYAFTGDVFVKLGQSLHAEHARMAWLSKRPKPLPMPTPRVVAFHHDEERQTDYLAITKLPGRTAADLARSRSVDTSQLVVEYARALAGWHQGASGDDADACPFDLSPASLSAKLLDKDDALATELAAVELLAHDRTVLHGDYCMPNVLHAPDLQVTGFLDLGELGVGDRHLDVAVGRWSVVFNLDELHGQLFVEAYASAHPHGVAGALLDLYQRVERVL